MQDERAEEARYQAHLNKIRNDKDYAIECIIHNSTEAGTIVDLVSALQTDMTRAGWPTTMGEIFREATGDQ